MSIRITLTPSSYHVDFEVGSPEEGISFVEEKSAGFMRLLDVLGRLPKAEGEGLVAGEVTSEAPARRTRGPNKSKVDAIAPPPLQVPGAAPPSPPVPPSTTVSISPSIAGTAPPQIATTGGTTDGGMPDFLKRDANNQLPGAPPAAAPPPPPAPPAPPPSGVLAEKIIANLDKRKASTPDNGQSLSDWLAGCGLVIKGATYDEAIAMLRLAADAKLQPLLVPLEIAA